jgi:hypothetical protein
MSNDRNCFACSKTTLCEEFQSVLATDPHMTLAHACEDFSGIRDVELMARKNALEQLGIAAAYGLESVQINKGRRRKKKMAYTAEELKKTTMKRYTLRQIASQFGMPLKESTNTNSDALIKFIMEKQGGAKSKPPTSKPVTKAAPEPEADEPETPEALPVGTDPTALIQALAQMLEDFRKEMLQAVAVIDRKQNFIIGSQDAIGKVVVDEDFDTMKHEIAFAEAEYAVELGAIQESSADFTKAKEGR